MSLPAEPPSSPTYRLSFQFRRILVPFDGSADSMKALDLAIDFAQRYGSTIVVLHVKSPGEADNVLEKARQALEKAGVNYKVIEKTVDPNRTSVPHEIVKEASEGIYDAVILGARGKTLEADYSLGSVATAVVVNAPVTVIVVR